MMLAPPGAIQPGEIRDLLTPPDGVKRIRDHLYPLYARHGKAEDCRIELFDCGHEELPAMRKLVLEWLDRYLVAR